ncbi:MAG: alpha/beta hydrolase family protein [Luteibaculaceae bacterium]
MRYKSSDGLEIPAYLTLPKGLKGKKLPVIVLVHGGPKGPRDYWGYDASVQFLANRGYAVLQPNFRASGGYGKDFLNAGDLQWGKLMQDDITWGVKYLIDQKIADPKKVAIMGGSYGGYATLAGLAFTPDLYAAGVDIVGPSNIFTLLESVPAYWEAGRAFLYGMVGDPNTPEGEKLIREASPLFSADKIVKPLLIIQGANDPRVKKAEADQIAIALRDKGKKVSYLLADDEGHGFSKPVNNMAMYAEIERFLSETVGGRYQNEMPENVAKRLEELRVDISTVTFTPKEEKQSSKDLPAIAANLVEGTNLYNIVIEVQGQKIDGTLERIISKEGENWVIKDVSKLAMMGESTDAITFNGSFTPLSRKITQMGQNIEMSYEPNQINVSMMGQNMTLNTDAAYLTDGAGYDLMLAGLAAHPELVFLMPDLGSMKTKQVTYTTATEEREGKTYKTITVVNNDNEADKTTVWLNKEDGSFVKMVQVLPTMGNAKFTMTKP